MTFTQHLYYEAWFPIPFTSVLNAYQVVTSKISNVYCQFSMFSFLQIKMMQTRTHLHQLFLWIRKEKVVASVLLALAITHISTRSYERTIKQQQLTA